MNTASVILISISIGFVLGALVGVDMTIYSLKRKARRREEQNLK